MDKAEEDKHLRTEYETLLTRLCQQGQASIWGWCSPVADPARAMIAVTTSALMFGDKVIRSLASRLPEYLDRERLRGRLEPLLCSGRRLERVLHITASCLHISGSLLYDKDILIWDAGKGSRMGVLLKASKSKGDVDVCGDHKLFHLAAGVGEWLVSALRKMGKEYVALVASDQVVCLSCQTKKQLRSFLEVACARNADMIIFDGPPELGVMRLRFFLASKRQPQRNSLLALARDRTMLKYFGGAHILQCVVIRKDLAESLATALEVIVRAAGNGFDLDYGVYDVALAPCLIRPRWLEREHHPAAHQLYSALCDLRAKVKRVFTISMPIQVFNVNTPLVLKRLRKRIVL